MIGVTHLAVTLNPEAAALKATRFFEIRKYLLFRAKNIAKSWTADPDE